MRRALTRDLNRAIVGADLGYREFGLNLNGPSNIPSERYSRGHDRVGSSMENFVRNYFKRRQSHEVYVF